jgi:flagellar assembly protein FliH
MSSKLLRSGEANDAVPVLWRQIGAAVSRVVRAHTDGPGVAQPEARIAELERQVETHAQAAYQQGQAAGESAAGLRATQRLDPVLASLTGVTKELTSMRLRFRKEAEEDTVNLAIAIARRVLHRELATDPEAILGLVIAAFQKLSARETHRLRVSPADAAALQENRARMDLPAGLEISPDPSVPIGSAIFETSRGELDASVDTQLAEIQRGFADVIRRRAK